MTATGRARTTACRSVRALLFTLHVLFAGATLLGQQSHPGEPTLIQDGRALYTRECSGCHGSAGLGTEEGPRLAGNPSVREMAPTRLHDTIAAGFPASGMPGFAALPARDLDAISVFVQALGAPPAETSVAAGDALGGKAYFWGEGGCSRCHMVHGKGSPIGPDLSDVGLRMSGKQLREMLLAPDMHIRPEYRRATVKARDGQVLHGFLRGRTNYDMQLQDLAGDFHLFESPEIVSVVEEKHSLMQRFGGSPEQLGNMVAYLGGLKGVSPGALEEPERDTAGADQTVQFPGILNPKPGNWPTYNGVLSGNRYSPLKQITPANVNTLALKWVFPMPQLGLEATPLVVDGIMYFSGQNQTYALDARTGRQIWRYMRPPTPGLVGDAKLGTNRGVAVLGDKIFVVTDNAHLLALNRITGALVWEVIMPEKPMHYGSTVAPLVVRNTVIAGVSGGDWGIRGFVACYEANTGKLVWRHWTLPAEGEPGIETWGRNPPALGGGATWLTGTYDAETDTLYWTTGNPYPDRDDGDRPGDNLYTNCVLAMNPDTGALKWFFQFTPHDTEDRDATEPAVLVDAEYRGSPRKLLLHADRNGFFYVMDRITGEVLLSRSFLKQVNWATGIDSNGRPLLAHYEGPASRDEQCPDNGANWSSTAYSPITRLYYVMTLESCHAIGPEAPGGAQSDALTERYLRAIDIATGKVAWEIPQRGPVVLKTWSGVMATASGLVIYGDPNGAFAAVDERTGKTLWHYDTNVGMKGPPMTYAVKGRQYIAVTAGSVLLTFALPLP